MKKILITLMFALIALAAAPRWSGWYMVWQGKCVPVVENQAFAPDTRGWCAQEIRKDGMFLDCSWKDIKSYWTSYYYFRTENYCKEWISGPGAHYINPPPEMQ